MPDTPKNEPLQLRAGDTWKWRREDLADYPATTWTLKYRFKNASGGFEVVAAADGANFAITLTATATAAYTSGRYDWLAWVESGAEKYSVDQGTLEVLPDLRTGTATAALDARSDARRIYDDLLTAYKSYIANRGTVKSYTIGSRSMTFHSTEEILKQLNYWRAEVAREEAAERARNNIGTGNKLFVR